MGFTYVYIGILWILGGLIHFWTVYIAYNVSGWFWGLVTLFFPIISQIIWGFRAWSLAGFESAYLQWLVVFAALWGIYAAFVAILMWFAEKT